MVRDDDTCSAVARSMVETRRTAVGPDSKQAPDAKGLSAPSISSEMIVTDREKVRDITKSNCIYNKCFQK